MSKISKDRCGYRIDDDWFVTNEELRADPRLKVELRKIHAEKISKMIAVVFTMISLIVSGLVIRHMEYKYFMKENNCVLK